MSEPIISSIASGTGRFPALQTKPEPGSAIEGGKVSEQLGKSLPAPASAPSEPELREFVRQLNTVNRTIGRDLRFQVDLERGYAIIQVLDRDTGELIRQIPPEKATAYIAANGALELRLYDELV